MKKALPQVSNFTIPMPESWYSTRVLSIVVTMPLARII